MGADRLVQLSLVLQNRCLEKLGKFFLSDNSVQFQIVRQRHEMSTEQSQHQEEEEAYYSNV